MLNNNDWRSFGELFEDYVYGNNTGVCIKTGIKQVDDIMRIEESSLTVIAGAKEKRICNENGSFCRDDVRTSGDHKKICARLGIYGKV